MSVFDQSDISSLVEWYMFANTPAYLYKHFREAAIVQRLAEMFSVEQLVEAYRETTADESLTLEQVVSAYAVLIAIAEFHADSVEQALQKVDLSKIQWGSRIAEIAKRTPEEPIENEPEPHSEAN